VAFFDEVNTVLVIKASAEKFLGVMETEKKTKNSQKDRKISTIKSLSEGEEATEKRTKKTEKQHY